MYIDTHCHISKEDYDDIDSVIRENQENGVNTIILSGCTRDTIKETLSICNQYLMGVYATIGFHPSEAGITTSSDLGFMEELLTHYKIVGIGEIGLDYHYGKEDMEKQKELFRRQMEIAEKHHLPVVIHSRDATQDTIEILKEYPNVVGDIHCFSGSVETAKEYVSMGYKIGIGGVVTFKNSNLYKVVQEIGIDNILLETDAPYLAPEPFRGKINSSKYIPIIAKKVAEILSLEEEEVAKKTSENAIKLFDLVVKL